MSGAHAAEGLTLGSALRETVAERTARLAHATSELGSRATDLCGRGAIRLEASLMTLATTKKTRNEIVRQTLSLGYNDVDRRVAQSLVRHNHADEPIPYQY